MHIHYSQNFINGLIGIGGLNFVIGLASLTTVSPAWFLLIVGVLLLALAFRLRRRPLLTIEQDKIVLHGLIARFTRIYPVQSQEDVTMEGNMLYVMRDGTPTRIPISKGMIAPKDWAELKARYGQTQQ